MKIINVLAGLVLGLAVSMSTAWSAENDIKAESKASEKAEVKASVKSENKTSPRGAEDFVYKPPMRGAPAARIGGGTRGIGDVTLELVVLAPDHTGLTTKEQPTLYWYVSEPVPSKLEVTLINDENIDPEFEEVVATPGSAGIQSIDLAKTGAKLESGLEYRWFVSVIADPGQRSNDIVASGTIQRITPGSELKARITGADERSLVRVYAEEGVWYDAIDTLSRLIEKSPDDAALLQQRAALLEQVGLQAAAN